MRLATVLDGGRERVAVVRGDRVLSILAEDEALRSMRAIAGGGPAALTRVMAWAASRPDGVWRSLETVELRPAVPDPGAIYAIGLNYAEPGAPPGARPERPLVYGKLPSSVAADGARLEWDRRLSPNVDAEVELGVVIGEPAWQVSTADAAGHVVGYTCMNDISSRDPWLDGDQWLLGKSMPGFCPVGPWIVTADELDPSALRLGCRIGSVAIQDGTTASMRYSIAEIVAFLSRHVMLRPGDLIATGTPARLPGPLAPERHLERGDDVTAWIEGVGQLRTTIA
ncbi:MAG TPA: fumarylacetoacetate hydrolase family protein [Candidatus Dormibacteraeota bacterium]|nr:fumarylacetoacetate hydrolase family protein [Candidatus Dormibacteraeota bacterium]